MLGDRRAPRVTRDIPTGRTAAPGGRRRRVAGALAAIALLVGAACESEQPPSEPATPPPSGSDPAEGAAATCGPADGMVAHAGLPYASAEGVDADLLSLDVYAPTWDTPCGPAPVLVWVHGGGWRRGDKANSMADKVALAQQQGWVLVSVNYRLSEPGPDGTIAVTYPTHNEDVATAVAWVVDEIAAYGGDPRRVTLMGHSAGAGIVSSVGTDPRYLADAGVPSGTVDCVVSLDTEAYDVAAQAGAGSTIYRNAFGDDPAVWADASPLTHVGEAEDLPAFLVVVQGSQARRDLSQRFVDAVEAAGGDATLVVAQGLDHNGVNAAVGAEGDTVVTPPLVEFLEVCAAG